MTEATEHNTSKNTSEDANVLLEEQKHEELKKLCVTNAEYFAKDSSESGQRLYLSFLAIKDNIDLLWPKVLNIRKVAADYDFDEQTPGNGYRSFLDVVDSAFVYGIELNKRVSLKKDSVLFRKAIVAKEIESCAHLIASLDACLNHLEKLITCSEKGDLFPKDDYPQEEIFRSSENINQYCFYGRCMGFQFCESMKSILKFIVLSMAVFSEAYYSEGSVLSKATNSVMTTTKYFTDPEERAKRVVNISQNAEIDFCKAFWFLSESELMHHLPAVVAPSVAVSKIIHLPPEPFTLTVDGKEIEVPVPKSHIGTKSIPIRLISSEIREGMVGEGQKSKVQPPSRGLLIHCHGGGFVAQSSRSHEGYLRHWAKELNVPILSIDYSLAPHAPYPRALEEITYAYCWALKNCQLLGSTGERIVGAGDSAGANLILTTSLKCIDLGVPPPMGLFLAYAPTYLNFMPSPARLLCMMDPLLTVGFISRCIKAYVCPDVGKEKNGSLNGENTSDSESFEEISESDLMELQAHKSPVSETSDTLTYGSLNSQTEDLKEQDTIKEKSKEIDPSLFDILDKYILDSDTDTDGTKVPILTRESTSSSQTFSASIQGKMSAFVTNLRGHLENFVPKKTPSGATKLLDTDKYHNVLEEFKFVVPKDPYLSPYCASDDILKKLPPVRILTVNLDPLLDDCVMFARKLKRLNHDIRLEILNGLPHGFLNLSLVSKDALEGSKLCIKTIGELLNLDALPPPQL